jgi:hypothetical protein
MGVSLLRDSSAVEQGLHMPHVAGSIPARARRSGRWYRKLKLRDGTTRDEHRVIMEQHLGRRLGRFEVVHHKNGDRQDNRLENLEVMSLSDHARLHWSLEPRHYSPTEAERAHLRSLHQGSKSPSAKLDDDKVRWIRQQRKNGVPCRVLARQLGVSHFIISRVACGLRWAHVPDIVPSAA